MTGVTDACLQTFRQIALEIDRRLPAFRGNQRQLDASIPEVKGTG
jgi:hypothetical protein